MTRAKDISKIVTDANLSGTLDVTGDLTVDTNTLHVDSANNRVGIGTSSPDDTLEVNGIINIKRSNELSVLSTTATGVANFEFGFNKSGGTARGMPNDTAFINMRQGYPIVIATQETERMRITDGGNVGIGTSSPNRMLSLENGDLQIHETGSSDPLLQFSVGNTQASPTQSFSLRIDNSDSDKFQLINGISGEIPLTVDTSGNVGIGTSSPQRPLHVDGVEGVARFTSTASGNNGFEVGIGTSSQAFLWQSENSYMQFATNATERMRIDSFGRAILGTTGPIASSNAVLHINADGISSGAGSLISQTTLTSLVYQVHFRNGNGGVGGISTNGTSTAYATSSDHRLKENVTADWDATTRLKQLNPVRFNFIADADTTVDGFLAHEVQSVVPEAITGTHNEVDADGNPVYQGIDQSKLVPLLVKTIQELEARITALENGE